MTSRNSTKRAVRTGLAAGLMAVAVFGAGCGSGDRSANGDAATQFPSPSGFDRAAEAEEAALAAYRGMWKAFVDAARTSDPEAPDLRKYASDQALQLISGSLYSDRSSQLTTQGELNTAPTVVELKPSDAPVEAAILDCVNDEKWLKYRASGGLVNDVPGGRHRTMATVKSTPDGWKVASFILRERGTC